MRKKHRKGKNSMGIKLKKLPETARNNKTAMISHIIVATVMLVFCFLQVTAGMRSIGLFVLDIILGAGPYVAELIFWKKDQETKMIKHLVAIGFAVFFTYTLFTCENNLVMMFAIPMVMSISVYNDTKLSIEINTGTVLLAIITNVLGAGSNRFGYENMDDATLQVVIMCLVATISYYTARTSYANSKLKVDEAMAAKEESDRILEDLQKISKVIHDAIKHIYGELEKLKNVSDTTKEAMIQLSTGANEAADAVQKQTSQTEEIQSKVDVVTEASEQIRDNMQQTMDVLQAGSHDVERLVDQVEKSVTNGAMVADKLEKLDGYVEEMHSIVKLISGIANQTSMLALNASIEAARAGDAGRGFAVVATQVTSMAGQTKDATIHISDLIENVSTAISEVVVVIRQMLDGIQEEKQTTTNTAESFDNIQNNTLRIKDNIEALVNSIEELKVANEMIVDSIQTISAISQEVSAHASETVSSEEETSSIIDEIDHRMHQLIEYIKLN